MLGTARIIPGLDHKGEYFAVFYTNIGSALRNEPRWFSTEKEAREFCAERRLQVQ